MNLLSDQILSYLFNLEFPLALPADVEVLNPFKGENETVIKRTATAFYKQFYGDKNPRTLILGINPGRLGAGSTGIPFSDTKRLESHCGISVNEFSSHEPSSVFVYDMIDAFSGVDAFYQQFFIGSTVPLGFVQIRNGKPLNFNYYDDKNFALEIEPYIVDQIRLQQQLCTSNRNCLCLGKGKNYAFLKKMDKKYGLFDRLIAIEHPRYIMQYKYKERDWYINKYLDTLHSLLEK